MNESTSTFSRLRPRLQSIAYRMLGSVAEAEEVVQDIWLRWYESEATEIANDEAWLVSATTRLSIDRLRSAKVRRDAYPGLWLPEPRLADHVEDPESLHERAEELSTAFLVVLERLAPEARAAFLLREIFDFDYDEVAGMVGKSEAACRKLVQRAKQQLKEGKPRQVVSDEAHRRLLQTFVAAIRSGDFAAMKAVMADDAELVGDGGGKVPSFPKPLLGGPRIAQLFYASHLRFGDRLRVEFAEINGRLGLLRFIEGELESSQSFETDGRHIVAIHVQRNPEKLSHVRLALQSLRDSSNAPATLHD